MTYQGTRQRRYLIMASVAVLSLGVGIGSGIGIFGIFHTPNPCDSMKIKVVENLKVSRDMCSSANDTACVGLNTHGHFVKLTSNSDACNNACEAYHKLFCVAYSTLHQTERSQLIGRTYNRVY